MILAIEKENVTVGTINRMLIAHDIASSSNYPRKSTIKYSRTSVRNSERQTMPTSSMNQEDLIIKKCLEGMPLSDSNWPRMLQPAKKPFMASNFMGRSVMLTTVRMIVLVIRLQDNTWDINVGHLLDIIIVVHPVTVEAEVVRKATVVLAIDIIIVNNERDMKDLVMRDLVRDTTDRGREVRRNVTGVTVIVIGMVDATEGIRNGQLLPKDVDAQDLDQPEGDDNT